MTETEVRLAEFIGNRVAQIEDAIASLEAERGRLLKAGVQLANGEAPKAAKVEHKPTTKVARKPRDAGVRDRVLGYLKEADTSSSIDEIASDVGITKTQASQALGSLKKAKAANTVGRGQWVAA